MKYAPPFQRTNGFVPVILCLLALVILPFFFTDTYSRHVLILVFIYAIVASSWDLSLGFGGIVNFAHLAFFAVGLYSYGILTKLAGIDPWVAILLGGVIAAGFAAMIAVPILRLDGIYVILVTIAAILKMIGQRMADQQSVAGGVNLLNIIKQNSTISFNPVVARKCRNEA